MPGFPVSTKDYKIVSMTQSNSWHESLRLKEKKEIIILTVCSTTGTGPKILNVELL